MWPKISVITPSYNQGKYLDDTIVSVLGQNYDDIEYLIMDGGSTDETVEVIKRYEKHLHFWCSEKDKGQADAINKGFEKTTGDILGWLNSDDLYMPGTLHHIAAKFDTDKAQVVFGNCLHFRQDNPRISFGSDLSGRVGNKDFLNGSIIQPSTFWTRKAWEQVGSLYIDMHYAFDLDWFNRAKVAGVEFIYTPRHLSLYRIHSFHKTATGGDKRLLEIARVYGKVKGTEYENAFSRLIGDQKKIRRFINLTAKLGIEKNREKFIFLAKLFFRDYLAKIHDEDIFFMLHRLA